MNSSLRAALSLILFCVIASAALAETQSGGMTITMQPGKCQTFLNGVDVGCPTGAGYSRLEHGRHLVNFPAAEIATSDLPERGLS